MLGSVAALELHVVAVVAVPGGVARARGIQGVVEDVVQGVVADVAEEVAEDVAEEDVAEDSMFLCSIISPWRSFNYEFFRQTMAAPRPP
jgi:hypothetical protein